MLGIRGRDDGGPRWDQRGKGTLVITWVCLVDETGLVVRWIVNVVISEIGRVVSHALQLYYRSTKKYSFKLPQKESLTSRKEFAIRSSPGGCPMASKDCSSVKAFQRKVRKPHEKWQFINF